MVEKSCDTVPFRKLLAPANNWRPLVRLTILKNFFHVLILVKKTSLMLYSICLLVNKKCFKIYVMTLLNKLKNRNYTAFSIKLCLQLIVSLNNCCLPKFIILYSIIHKSTVVQLEFKQMITIDTKMRHRHFFHVVTSRRLETCKSYSEEFSTHYFALNPFIRKLSVAAIPRYYTK